MRRFSLSALGAAIFAFLPAQQAQSQDYVQYHFAGCNSLGTCGTATLFVNSLTGRAEAVSGRVVWAEGTSGLVAGAFLGGSPIPGLGGAWERTGCQYPSRTVATTCGFGFLPLSPPLLPADFQPSTVGITVGYGATDDGRPVSVAPLALIALPEPASLALVGSGLLALGGLVRRRKRRQESTDAQ